MFFFIVVINMNTGTVIITFLGVHFGLFLAFRKLEKIFQFCHWRLVQIQVRVFQPKDNSHYSGLILKYRSNSPLKHVVRRNEKKCSVNHKTTILILTSFIFSAKL